jgi:RNA-directed DNA polymerase
MLNDTGTEGQVGRHGDMVDVVNGPEGGVLDWRLVDWRQAEDDVRRLRQRIFAASRAGDLAKARNLQKLMLRSRANTLVSVRRVTEINAGRHTAAPVQIVDGPARQAGVHPQGRREDQGARDSCDR